MAKMTQAQRNAEVAAVDVYVADRMRQVAVRIVEAEAAGAYPDGLPPMTGRVLSLGLLFQPDLPKAPLPGAE